MRVLVADTTPATHQLVHKLLGEKGHELAASAKGAKEFLQCLAAGGADVALVDWGLLAAVRVPVAAAMTLLNRTKGASVT